MRFVLASASPARLTVLRNAGVEPVVRVSGVDEDAVAAALPDPEPAELVTALAVAKAEAVAGDERDAVVVGCDSMLLTPDGDVEGKPGTVEVARERWRRMAGRSGTLLTGHAVLRVVDGRIAERAAGHEATVVRFGTPSEAELEAYLASGEPLGVAGAFTLDGRGGWFVDGIDGDPSSVIGISLPLTRRLLRQVDVAMSDIW
ncbi:Maf family protein [Actinosynnema sp. NPDC047251]|uniref:Nucleoside triphosphate pyrophosphatase n=1 Tax=Saccharothrix espanaensis (strain ATCC 51144 / DSM 44229 / JCM 9112 / NBRC 15066 / NRRL 15764) TaxID=1179773 RepID=K0K3Q9_SACES|nr:Maf family protein [Saccharothrix espanaensis]CCH34895.1 Maf-like protein [Saccharothrix espanaensis DSM 44229]